MNEAIIISKLRALKNKVESFSKSIPGGSSIFKIDFEVLLNPFETYRKQLAGLNTDLYGDFVPEYYDVHKSSDDYYYGWALETLLRNIQFILDLANTNSSIVPHEVKITTEGIFFAGQYFDAFVKVAEILKNSE